MSLDHNPQCSACKIANSLMWRRGSNGEILCNSCHLKRVNSSVRAQRQSSKESKKLIARIKAGTRKGWNGKSGERSRGRRSLQKMKRKPYKSPEGFATVVAADRIYYKETTSGGTNRPFAARGHVLGYRIATQNWRASASVNKLS